MLSASLAGPVTKLQPPNLKIRKLVLIKTPRQLLASSITDIVLQSCKYKGCFRGGAVRYVQTVGAFKAFITPEFV